VTDRKEVIKAFHAQTQGNWQLLRKHRKDQNAVEIKISSFAQKKIGIHKLA
jgi:hypothetical protein